MVCSESYVRFNFDGGGDFDGDDDTDLKDLLSELAYFGNPFL